MPDLVKIDLLNRIKSLEHEIEDTLEAKARTFRYHWAEGRVRFEKEVLREHKRWKVRLRSYLAQSRLPAALSAPVIYSGFIPFLLLDAFLTVYQGICFPIYGIPKVRRRDYIVFDRARLGYLNSLEKFNCFYCSYANGLFAYGTEIAARTEQHWCPIKHAQRLRTPHSRYRYFLDYGDAQGYSQKLEKIRQDYKDLGKPPG